MGDLAHPLFVQRLLAQSRSKTIHTAMAENI
jgi:hypothetical protein